MGFLSSYRVIDLTNEKGIFAGKLLGDLGADVIQVEPVCGSSARNIGPFIEKGEQVGSSLFWEAYASNKRGITCNLDTEYGRELLIELCKTADILFESYIPGYLEQRGLSYEDLQKVNPKLIYVSITPFGSKGPKAQYAESDITMWAAGGALRPNKQENRPPVRVSLPQSYLHAAADAAGAALIAHFARLKTGGGQHIDVSTQQSVAQATLSRILSFAVGDHFADHNELGAIDLKGKGKRVIDQSGSGSAMGRSKWQIKDGYLEMHLAMGPSAGRFSNNLMSWLFEKGAITKEMSYLDWVKVPSLLENGEITWDEIDDIYETVANFLKSYTKQELMEIGLSKKILMAPVYTVSDLAESPQLKERNFWVDIQGRDGRNIRLPGPFAKTTVEDAFEYNYLAPQLGEHNFEVYNTLLGLTENEINSLRQRRII